MTEIGINLPWFGGAYGHDLGRNQAYADWPVWYDSRKVDELLEFVRSFGIRLVRVWLFEEGEGIDSAMRLDELFFRNLQDLAGRIRAAGMEAYWTLFDANAVGQRDQITARILTDPSTAERFAAHTLAAVAPIIADIAWAIDLCNEPEAMVAGPTGSWATSGHKWSELQPALAVLRESVARLLPGIGVSIGSGYHNHENIAAGIYDQLNLDLDFYDFHLYMPVEQEAPTGQATSLPHQHRFNLLQGLVGQAGSLPVSSKPVVLGEIGCVIAEPDRKSAVAWEQSQACLVKSMDGIRDLGFEAVFLWYLSDPDSADATALVYQNRTGAALRAISSYPNTRRPLT